MSSGSRVSDQDGGLELGWTYRCHARWIRFHACDAGFLCFADDIWCERFVQVERHEVVDLWFNGSQAIAVRETLLDCRNGWDEIGLGSRINELKELMFEECFPDMIYKGTEKRKQGNSETLERQVRDISYHDIDLIYSTLSDRGRDKLRHFAIS
jgi:hypothetical protein